MISALAPASIGNVAAGFDVLGLAIAPVDGPPWGDVVSVTPGEPRLEVRGPYAAKLPKDPAQNLVSHALRLYTAAQARSGNPFPTLTIHLEKNLPLASGLGSSSASIVASLVAFEAVAAHPLGLLEVLKLAGAAEGVFSGAGHLDNVAPALLGGLRLVPPADVEQLPRALPWPEDLRLVVVHPDFELPTVVARRALPKSIPLVEAVRWGQNLAAFVVALQSGDRELLRCTFRDLLAEPHRALLVPGFLEAQSAALDQGALACTLSGAGPSVFAVASLAQTESIATSIVDAFANASLRSRARICRADPIGARLL